MNAKLLLLVVALAVTATARNPHLAPDPDHCAPYLNCTVCLDHHLCGWCSAPITYPDGTTGPQCAGWNTNSSNQWKCTGIYSTEQCVQGYVCNQTDFTCQLGAPGHGSTQEQCEANCTNNGEVYLCNKTTKQCYEVPPGTSGAKSLGICQASCSHPSPHPAPPPPPPPSLYACNYTTGQCVNSSAGKGSSKEACQQTCTNTSTTKYMCSSFLHKCVPMPPNTPGGYSLQQCEVLCAPPKPQPGPPPAWKLGLWRGVAIQADYSTGEFDLDVTDTNVTMVWSYVGQPRQTVYGTPYHMEDQLVVAVTSGADEGKMLFTTAETSGQPGAETIFMAIAFAPAGQAAPPSVEAAMTTSGMAVYAMEQCQTPECHFYLPGDNSTHHFFAAKHIAQRFAVLSAAIRQVEQPKKKITARDNDHCTQYGISCAVCLQNQYCGWCSTNVTYKDNTEGSQCAGFNTPTGGGGNFTCVGEFSTESCLQGYECSDSYQCVMAPPGDGVPKEQCEQTCKPTPKPTPPPPQYVCNTTTKQCLPCNSSYCPSGLPLGPCQASCSHPKHGPHSEIKGVWRGNLIQNGYPIGEVDLLFGNETMTAFWEGQQLYIANVTSYGADAMLLKILDGDYQGWHFGMIYQLSNQDSMYEAITVAKGILNEGLPTGYDQAMTTNPMEVMTLYKCLSAPCAFMNP